MNRVAIRYIGIGAIALIVANMFLFAFRIINATWFWIIIVIVAIIAWGLIPYLRKHAH